MAFLEFFLLFFELEIERAKQNRISTEMLQKLRETTQRTAEDKRKLDLESELYKRWRCETRENQILLDSKSDNETLAKMNWLDRQVSIALNKLSQREFQDLFPFQISNQMEKEKHEKEMDERRIRLSEEARKREELLSARKQLRYGEISELQKLQEKKLGDVRGYEQQLTELHKQEMDLRRNLEQIGDELSKLESTKNQRIDRISLPHNFRRIKMLLRDRSDVIRNDLRQDIEMLKRIPLNHQNEQMIRMLRENFEMQFDLEIQKQAQIEAMYESEAKESLFKQQEIWTKDSNKRLQHLHVLLVDQEQHIQSEIDFVVRRQTEVADDRESCRKLADDAVERIRNLRKIDEEDDRVSLGTDFVDDLSEAVQENITIRSTNDSARPKHGRKKVVWT